MDSGVLIALGFAFEMGSEFRECVRNLSACQNMEEELLRFEGRSSASRGAL